MNYFANRHTLSSQWAQKGVFTEPSAVTRCKSQAFASDRRLWQWRHEVTPMNGVAFWQTQPAIFTSAWELSRPMRGEHPSLHTLITCAQLLQPLWVTGAQRKSKKERRVFYHWTFMILFHYFREMFLEPFAFFSRHYEPHLSFKTSLIKVE